MLLLRRSAAFFHDLFRRLLRLGALRLQLQSELILLVCAFLRDLIVCPGKLLFILRPGCFRLCKRSLSVFIHLLIPLRPAVHELLHRLIQQEIHRAEEQREVEHMQKDLLEIDIQRHFACLLFGRLVSSL